MGASSKDKGNAWELEVAKFLEENFEGFEFDDEADQEQCLVEKMQKTQTENVQM